MNKQKGIASLVIMIAMLIMAVALPITTKLVQQTQENRSKAAIPIVGMRCADYINGASYPNGTLVCGIKIDSYKDVYQCRDGAWNYIKTCANGCLPGGECKSTPNPVVPVVPITKYKRTGLCSPATGTYACTPAVDGTYLNATSCTTDDNCKRTVSAIAPTATCKTTCPTGKTHKGDGSGTESSCAAIAQLPGCNYTYTCCIYTPKTVVVPTNQCTGTYKCFYSGVNNCEGHCVDACGKTDLSSQYNTCSTTTITSSCIT